MNNKSSLSGNGDGSEKPDLKNGFLVVGIGASAGGIQALSEFFSNVPENSGIAYVVILHLSPDHDSRLAHVLQQTTKIPVTQVLKKTRIHPNHVYVVSPDKSLSMEDGSIVVKPIKTVEERRAPVDIFFRTLAESQKANAIGVILSGTGANGSMGLKRIKERGGATFAQNPREAEFNEMPRNAIATELVDMILPVAQIPGQILGYRDRTGLVEIPEEPAERPEDQQTALREIFTQLRVRTGHDFSNYKRPTMLRRIERRITVRNLADLPAYAEYIRENPEEANALLKDLLISVTNFFRDRKAFDALEQKIFPALIEGRQRGKPLRIWVAGCATGEEAYSIAMLAAEQAEVGLDGPPVQIFATDIDEQSIAVAREGLYTLNDAADVSPERLRRFFTKEGDLYRVRREIREMILFAQHNLIKDPPFSHLDFVSCRNLLIYLNHTAQERVMETIHFALKPGGYLFVGTSESVDGSSDLFAPIDKSNHIFQSRQVATRPFPIPDSVPVYRAVVAAPGQGAGPTVEGLERITYNDLHLRLLEELAPPSIVINQDYEIVHISKNAGKYLVMAGGEPTNNILRLIKPQIRLELRTALFQAVQHKSNVEVKSLKTRLNSHEETINILVRPITDEADTARGFILVVFEPAAEAAVPSRSTDYDEPEPVAQQLEEELVRSKTQLQSALEQAEVQSEELRASNEELQAMNEELRSSAEELETGKEELQSINEELTTVNQELKVKIEELSHTNNNFSNLLNSIDIGVIFLDRSLRVNLFSPAASRVFNLIAGDIGRPLSDITNLLDYHDLAVDAELVLEKLQSVEREVQTKTGRVFEMRVFPYRTGDDRINGVVLTFVDITERKHAEIAVGEELKGTTTLHKLSQRLVTQDDIQVIFEDILDAAIRLANAQAGTVQIYDGVHQELEVIASRGFSPKVMDHFHRLDAGSASSCGIALASGKRTIIDFDDPALEDADGSLKMHVAEGYRTGQSIPLVSRSGKPIGMVSTHWREHYRPSERELRFLDLLARQAADIIGQRQAENALRASEEQYRNLFNSIDEGFCIVEVLFDQKGKPLDYRFLETNPAFVGQTGLSDAAGKTMLELAPQHEKFWFEIYGEIAVTGEPRRFEHQSEALNRWYDVYAFRAGSPEERKVAIIFNDVAARRSSEESIRFQAQLLNSVKQSVIATDVEGKVIFWNTFAENMFGWSEEEALGRSIMDLTTPEMALKQAGEIMEHVRRGQSWEGEFLVKRRDGSEFMAHVVNSPINDAEGNLIGIVGVSIDMEERRRMEAALRRSEERLRLLMESFTDYAIMTTDAKGTVENWNPGAEKIFGYTAEEITGQSSDIIFTPEDRANGAPENERSTARTNGRASDERWHIRKDGTRFFASGVMAPLFDRGRLLGFAKIARDLTEQKRVSEQLQQSREKLEERVSERTEELNVSNVKLRQEIAERKKSEDERVGLLRRIVTTQEEERSRIARDIHDQLGQRLTALRLKIASIKDLCSEEDELCERVDRLAEMGAGLDREVSFLAWELRPTVLDDLGLVAAADNYTREWSQHFEIPAEFHSNGMKRKRLDPEIETNLYRIAQEALNNISKHSKASRVNVLLESRKKEIVLIVEDNGVGFDLAKQIRVRKSGHGLGLIGMRERAAICGGRVEIESKPGLGTTVFVRVPAKFAPKGGQNGK